MVNFSIFSKLYLIFLPLTFIVGPAAFEIFIIYGLIIFTLNLNKVNLQVYIRIFKAFLFINILLIFISFFSIDIFQSFKSTVFLFRFLVLSLFIALIVDKLKLKDFEIIFCSISFLTFFIFVDSLIQLKFGYNIFKFDLVENSRVSSFFGDELILGYFILNLFVFNYFFFLKIDNKEKYKYLLFFVISISFLIIFFSGERSSLFKFCIFILFIYFFNNKKKSLFIKFVDIIIIFLIIVILLNHNFFSNFIDRIINKTFIDFFSGSELKFFSSIHQNYLISSLEIFKQNLLLGTGPNTFDVACEKIFTNYDLFCSTHPHNLYLQALSETGAIGILILLSLFIYVFYNLIFYFKKRNEVKFFLSLYFFIILLPLPSSNLFSNKFLFFISIFFGLFISRNNKIKNIIKDKTTNKLNFWYYFIFLFIIILIIEPLNYKLNQLNLDKLTFQNHQIKKNIKNGIQNFNCYDFYDYDYAKDKNLICQISSSENFDIKKNLYNITIEETSQNQWGYFRINFMTLKFINKNCKNYGIIVHEIKNIKNNLRMRIGYNLNWKTDDVIQENKIYLIKDFIDFEQISFDFYYTNPGSGQTILSFPELICYRSLL